MRSSFLSLTREWPWPSVASEDPSLAKKGLGTLLFSYYAMNFNRFSFTNLGTAWCTLLWFMIILWRSFCFCAFNFGSVYCAGWFESKIVTCQHVEVNRLCGDPKLSVLWKGQNGGGKLNPYWCLLPSFLIINNSKVSQLFWCVDYFPGSCQQYYLQIIVVSLVKNLPSFTGCCPRSY